MHGPPPISWPAELPIVAHRAEIAAAIAAHQVVVVCGETGSGKTTQLPKICLDLGRGSSGMIGHTQPRRIAARAVAGRIAEELATPLGGLVGYRVRFSDRTGPGCAIKLMTDGMLLAETQSDRRLGRYDTIIVDEAHERSLNIDFLLGYLHRLLPRRPELKLIITSATIDPQRFSEHFGGAPIIEVSGRMFPVEVRYRPLRSDDPDEQDRDMPQAILDAVDEAAAAGPGDVLVFLPGEREIREMAEALRKHHPPNTEILPLYARLSSAEQDRVFKPHRGRRIVLATNVAETALTVPGIRCVVDPGLVRISRYSARRRVQLLPIEPISQASAQQRAGRCGRVREGICFRLYGEDDFAGREPYTEPEIVRSNLAGVILRMEALGLGDVQAFPFIDPPRAAMVRDARRTLHELGALDDADQLTKLGRRLAALPVDPRLGRMLLVAEEEACLAEVLVIASALSVQDPRLRPIDRAAEADEAHRRFFDEHSDFTVLLQIWRFYHEQQQHLSWSKLRRCCEQGFISFRRMREWVDVHRQLKRQLSESGHRLNSAPAAPEAIHRAVLTGLLSSIGRRGDGNAYTGAGGKTLHIFPGSVLFESRPKWIMAAELVETTRLYARTAARIEPAWIERLAGHLVERRHGEPSWSRRSARVTAEETVTLYGLPIARRRVHYGPIDPAVSRRIFIEALVSGEFDPAPAAFIEHNRRIVARIEQLQARARRRDLLAGAAALEAFYDKRLPDDVYSGASFHRWRQRAERRSPRLLHMGFEDVLMQEAPEITPERYPDALHVGGAILQLEYRFEPGHAADGVTAIVPLAALHQIDEQRLAWLIPGYRRELFVALLRTLPKHLRREFVPAPDYVEACLQRIEAPRGHPAEALGRCLEQMTGATVPPDAWEPAALPDHLRMNVRVVDESGATLAEGRDLGALRRSAGAAARQALAGAADERYDRSGEHHWVFGELPESVTVQRGRSAVRGWPAVIDEGASVGVKLLDAPHRAEAAMRGGLRRLVLLELPGEIESAVEALPGRGRIELLASPLMPAPRLREQLALLIADRAAFDRPQLPRSATAFEQTLNRSFGRVWEAALEVGELAGAILEARQELALALDRPVPPQWSTAVADIRASTARLLPAEFLTATLWRWLREVPRYVQAEIARFRKLAHGGHARDERLAAQWSAWWDRYAVEAAGQREQGGETAALEEIRWMLQEWRVALFAQELGTSMPVSEKRIEERWGER